MQLKAIKDKNRGPRMQVHHSISECHLRMMIHHSDLPQCCPMLGKISFQTEILLLRQTRVIRFGQIRNQFALIEIAGSTPYSRLVSVLFIGFTSLVCISLKICLLFKKELRAFKMILVDKNEFSKMQTLKDCLRTCVWGRRGEG